jgi:microcystin degradation protein MlrC
MKKRVLLAGLFHETHTFLGGRTTWDDCLVRRGDEFFTTRGDGSPLAAAIEVGDLAGWEMLPTIDLRATPSATVDDAVVERFWDEFRAAAEPALAQGVDGIYLILHGAMCTFGLPDVEGEILARIRALPGAGSLPICGVVDLHGNFTQRMTDLADGLVAYRCNPHTDAHAASLDGARLLDRLLRTGGRAVTVWQHPAVVWPPTGTGTANEPMRTLEALARDIERRCPDIVAVNVFGGFSFADTPDTGVSFTAVTMGSVEQARDELRRLSAWSVEHREEGNVVDPPLAEVLPLLANGGQASSIQVLRPEGPILLVEPSDNIGGGAPGDGTAVLRALIEHRIDNAGVIINDPAAVAALAGQRQGDRVDLSIGGHENTMGGPPVTGQVELVSVSDGRFDLEDPHSHLASMSGTHINMGPSAVVRFPLEDCDAAGRIHILLTSLKTPPFDLGQWRSQGIDPEGLSVIGVKAAVAHRQAYDKIARASFTIDTPGPCTSNLRALPFRRIQRPIYPLD